MLPSRTIDSLSNELSRQAKNKADYVCETNLITYHSGGNMEGEQPGPFITFPLGTSSRVFGVTENFHMQLATALGIGQRYYNKLQVETTKAGPLLASNVNYWLKKDVSPRMIRTLDNKARALLSNKYRPLDNAELLETVLPIMTKSDCFTQSCEITDRKLYIKMVAPKIEFEVKVGDKVQAGLIISNSETGCGPLAINTFFYRLVCKNGLVAKDSHLFSQLRRTHIGSAFLNFNQSCEYTSNSETKARDRYFWGHVQEIIKIALDKMRYDVFIDKLKLAAKTRIEKRTDKLLRGIQEYFGLNNKEHDGVLDNYLMEDPTIWGLANALTGYAHTVENYDRATDFQTFGGAIINLPKKDWHLVSEAR